MRARLVTDVMLLTDMMLLTDVMLVTAVMLSTGGRLRGRFQLAPPLRAARVGAKGDGHSTPRVHAGDRVEWPEGGADEAAGGGDRNGQALAATLGASDPKLRASHGSQEHQGQTEAATLGGAAGSSGLFQVRLQQKKQHAVARLECMLYTAPRVHAATCP